MTVGVVQQSFTVIESASFVTVCVFLTGQTERDILVTMTTVQGTAQGMSLHDLLYIRWHEESQCVPHPSLLYYLVSPTDLSDFTRITAELTFQATVALQCSSISIVDDNILENDEVFSVQLSTLDPDVNVTRSTATVTIVNNDGECHTP